MALLEGLQDQATTVIAVILLFKVVGEMVIKFRGNDPLAELTKKIDRIERQSQDLWEWHSRTDEDGVKIWYVRKSFEVSIDRLADILEKHIDVLRVIERNTNPKD